MKWRRKNKLAQKAVDFSIDEATKKWIEELHRDYAEKWNISYLLKCECGSDIAGNLKHSEYCPKYEKE